ncbi:TonB-dependent receptor [Porphyromonas pogonae]|uniref:SusC/RagA family TonB-linked outer membrane protein n=1 Tax=Porphyromonas pogonae TaxID=867595 RepID=UPI002E7776B4|nr:TonB-dependent receptor [Porphyromonas pogonae]
MKRFTLFFAILFASIGIALAQQKVVKGVVISAEDNEPIIGASVFVKGNTKIGAATDVNGKFTLSVPADAKILVVSSVGMANLEVKIQPNMKIIMKSDSKQLDEVMVVAYGTTKKESFTGSAAVIKSDKLAERPISNVTKALDGLAPGVMATSGSGQPGEGASIMIRGIGSMNASASPLYVVDGAAYDGYINSINPDDIATITILKDASAGALYGARGANGVILITTKKGRAGKTAVNFKATWGFSSRAIPRYETVDAAGFIEAMYQHYKNTNLDAGLDPIDAGKKAVRDMVSGNEPIFGNKEMYNPYNMPAEKLIDPATGLVDPSAKLNYHSDWLKEAMRNNPLRQDYVVSVRGGSDNTKWMYSLGYLDELGLLKTTSFKRYTGRMNIDTKMTNWMNGGLSFNYAKSESNYALGSGSQNANVWFTAQRMPTIYPLYKLDENFNPINQDGKLVFDYGEFRPAGAIPNNNPVATLYDDKSNTDNDNLSGKTYINIENTKDNLLQGLKFALNFNFDLINYRAFSYRNPNNGDGKKSHGSATHYSDRFFSYTFNQLLTYDKRFNTHHVDLLLGHEFYSYKANKLSGYKTNFPFLGLYELDAAAVQQSSSSIMNNHRIESILSRFNYDFDNKYYFSFSYRRDASSRFRKQKRWGNFWSVGGNWRVSKEQFMQDVKWVDELSLRMSYGVQGNESIGMLYAWQQLYDLGYPNASFPGAMLGSLANPDLKWEKNGNFNIGVEGSLFNRLKFGIEWYSRKTNDMLMFVPMASSLGYDGYNDNVGSMTNSGFEVSLSGDIIKTKDFNWNLSLMGATMKNKVDKLINGKDIISGSRITREGEVYDSYFLPISAGIDPATGEQLFKVWDTDKDGAKGPEYITSNRTKAESCRVVAGNRFADLSGSIQNSLKYRNFDFGVMCTYSIGGKMLDGVYSGFLRPDQLGSNFSTHIKNAWRTPGQVTNIPRIKIGSKYTTTDSDLIDASYFAIKNISLGYNIPQTWVQKWGIVGLRLTATCDNVYMFTHLKGMNPQMSLTGGTSHSYVSTRMIAFGLDVKF